MNRIEKLGDLKIYQIASYSFAGIQKRIFMKISKPFFLIFLLILNMSFTFYAYGTALHNVNECMDVANSFIGKLKFDSKDNDIRERLKEEIKESKIFTNMAQDIESGKIKSITEIEVQHIVLVKLAQVVSTILIAEGHKIIPEELLYFWITMGRDLYNMEEREKSSLDQKDMYFQAIRRYVRPYRMMMASGLFTEIVKVFPGYSFSILDFADKEIKYFLRTVNQSVSGALNNFVN